MEQGNCGRIKNLPKNVHVTLSDQSQGMVKDARNYVGEEKGQISYQMIDCRQIPKEDHSFDKVIANHVLFYLDDRQQVFNEIKRVLKQKWNILSAVPMEAVICRKLPS